jgi:type I restriction enzyme S subunit
MADEWRKTTIDQLGRIVTGRTPSSEQPLYFGGDIPFVTPTDLDGRRIIKTTGRNLTTLGAHAVAAASIPAGAVMVSCIDSDMGKAAIAGKDCVTNQQINSIIVSAADDALYVYYNLSTRKAEIRSAAGGSAQPILNKSRFGQLPIRLPALRDQQAIASILGTLDEKIELNWRRNRTLEGIARALFQSWFVDFDPVKAKAAGGNSAGLSAETAALFPTTFEDSAVGPVPTGWRAGRWGEIATLEYGKSLRDYAHADGDVRVFGTNGPIGWHTEALCNGPGIVIGRKGAYRGIHYSPKPFYVIDTAFYLKAKETIDFKWAYYELLKSDINAMDSGSAIPSTSRADFYSIPVCVPSPAVVEEYGRRIQPVYDRKDVGTDEDETLAALRDALLPKLISGELRVPDAERIVGRAV